MYGPVRTVVWQGSAGDRRPYADQTSFLESGYRRGQDPSESTPENGISDNCDLGCVLSEIATYQELRELNVPRSLNRPWCHSESDYPVTIVAFRVRGYSAWGCGKLLMLCSDRFLRLELSLILRAVGLHPLIKPIQNSVIPRDVVRGLKHPVVFVFEVQQF